MIQVANLGFMRAKNLEGKVKLHPKNAQEAEILNRFCEVSRDLTTNLQSFLPYDNSDTFQEESPIKRFRDNDGRMGKMSVHFSAFVDRPCPESVNLRIDYSRASGQLKSADWLSENGNSWMKAKFSQGNLVDLETGRKLANGRSEGLAIHWNEKSKAFIYKETLELPKK